MIEDRFSLIERELQAILVALSDKMPELDQSDVQIFIDATEYSLAFEFMRDYIVEENISISKNLFDQMFHVADLMHSHATMITPALRNQIREEE